MYPVWNRRTKWRKKHAAEMISAKKRQEEVEVMNDMSDQEAEDELYRCHEESFEVKRRRNK